MVEEVLGSSDGYEEEQKVSERERKLRERLQAAKLQCLRQKSENKSREAAEIAAMGVERDRLMRVEINRKTVTMMAIRGYLILLLGTVMVASLAINSLFFRYKAPPIPGSDDVIGWLMQWYTSELLSLIGAVVLLFVGLRLVTAASKRVIPDDDRKLLEPLVSEGNRTAIEQYVALSSLTGFTGTFKIGFFGLPLATVTLTLLFCALSFLKQDFIEFAKLTLGAFIGSFVQRGLEAPKLPSIK